MALLLGRHFSTLITPKPSNDENDESVVSFGAIVASSSFDHDEAHVTSRNYQGYVWLKNGLATGLYYGAITILGIKNPIFLILKIQISHLAIICRRV
jgi:hypothetical protein